jgi:hypothetical protein
VSRTGCEGRMCQHTKGLSSGLAAQMSVCVLKLSSSDSKPFILMSNDVYDIMKRPMNREGRLSLAELEGRAHQLFAIR